MSYNGPPPNRDCVALKPPPPNAPPFGGVNRGGVTHHVRDAQKPECSVWWLIPLLLLIGCGVPDSGVVQPVKPIGSDAAHVIPAETKAYNAGLSIAYEQLASDVDAKKIKTVREAAEFAVNEDQRLRGEYKRAMGAMMEARLGSEELPADASKFFFEMSQAFGRLSK